MAGLTLLCGCAAPIRYGSPKQESASMERRSYLEVKTSRSVGHVMGLTAAVIGSDAICGKD